MPATHQYGALLLFSGITALLLQLLSRRLVWPLLEMAAGAVLVVTVGFGLLDLTDIVAHPSAQFGFVGWPVLVVIGYVLLFRMARRPAGWFKSKVGS